MYQGETITTVISGFPVPISNIKELYIVFKNNGTTILEKTKSDCVIEGETIKFSLTQEESLALKKGRIERSVVFLTADGKRFESDPSVFSCSATVKNEVI